mgnify:CR=1 FL=1
MKKWIKQFASEDWIIVFAGAIVLALAVISPDVMPSMPKTLNTAADWLSAGYMFLFVLLLTYVTSAAMRRPLKWIFPSLLVIFSLTLAAQLIASIPVVKEYGFESVFFAVILGLVLSNFFKLPEWLKSAVQSEFYIKIGIICLGSTILFGEVMKSGAYGLAQALIVVFTVWYFAFWLGRRMKIDPEMGTMVSSAVSICGVSAAIATCGVIKGDNKKLSYVISLVLIIAIPMMYLLPWLANITAAKTAVIVKSSQNVLLGVAAFVISLMWSYQGKNHNDKPTLGVIWDRFPKFVVGFVLASLVFSFCMDTQTAKTIGAVTKGFQNTLFSVAFVCIGLETRFKEIFSKENRVPLKVFLIAQGFNIIVTLLVAWLIFGIVKPMIG